MRTLLTFLLLSSIAGTTAFAQFTSVSYDLEKNYFNEGQALPAEKPLVFTGEVPTGIDIIEITILPSKNGKSPLYQTSWIDFDEEDNRTYSLSVNYPLRASTKYDIQFNFYESMPSSVSRTLTERITNQTDAYLAASYQANGDDIKAADKPGKMMAELENIIQEALKEYRFKSDQTSIELSAAVEQQLESLASLKKTGEAEATQQKMQSEVKAAQSAVRQEVESLMAKSWSKLAFTRYVDDYQTTEQKGSFAVNVGYGVVYLDGKDNNNNDDFSYDNSPYAGLSFPLSNSTIAPRFLRNASVSMGVFLDNFSDSKGNEISGLIVGRPFYLGLDYKLFEFIHFNVGATLLEKTTAATIDVAEIKTAYVRPFIGLSAKIDLSIGLGK